LKGNPKRRAAQKDSPRGRLAEKAAGVKTISMVSVGCTHIDGFAVVYSTPVVFRYIKVFFDAAVDVEGILRQGELAVDELDAGLNAAEVVTGPAGAADAGLHRKGDRVGAVSFIRPHSRAKCDRVLRIRVAVRDHKTQEISAGIARTERRHAANTRISGVDWRWQLNNSGTEKVAG